MRPMLGCCHPRAEGGYRPRTEMPIGVVLFRKAYSAMTEYAGKMNFYLLDN